MKPDGSFESYAEIAGRFPGIEEEDPSAITKFAFHVSAHIAPESPIELDTEEPCQGWHHSVGSVLRELRFWKEGGTETEGRIEVVQRIKEQVILDKGLNMLRDGLESADSSEGYRLVNDFVEAGGYQIRMTAAPSPLFPEGRVIRTSLKARGDSEEGEESFNMPAGSDLTDGKGNTLPPDIAEYIETGHRDKQEAERISLAIERLEPVSSKEFEEIRSTYGAKAAGLICFEKRVNILNKNLGKDSSAHLLEIPSFIPVSKNLYEAWLSESPDYEDKLEEIRLRVLGFEDDIHGDSAGLVAVRSSAVKSEDGDKHTGAGVYKSVAVDPKDQQAFRRAVEEVYASARNKLALSYQESIGVTDELMGLVIQRYQETIMDSGHDNLFYGQANSTGTNPNLVEIHIPEGSLLYDKHAILQQHMSLDRRSGFSSELLHSHPDHNNTKLRESVYRTAAIPHAVVLAEKLFGKPVQVEFADHAIVQVRPLHVARGEKVVFPDDEAIGNFAATGLGDMELELLDERSDNLDKKGFVVFHTEYMFTVGNYHSGYKAFPKEGAVIIIEPSVSGHIQAMCREKGLLCFYPKRGENMDEFSENIWGDNQEYENEPTENIKLRFVADGYEGRIYRA